MTAFIGRREFIALLGGAAAWPLAARAQQASKRADHRILGRRARLRPGAIGLPVLWDDCANSVGSTAGLLRSSIAGRTGVPSASPRSRPSSSGSRWMSLSRREWQCLAAKQATSVIPIVFAVASDPIGPGMVANLARPGHNITGLSLQAPDLAGKRLGLLREVVPGLRRLAVLANAGNPAAELEMREVEATAGGLGFEFAALKIRRVEDITPAFEALKDRADALYVCGTDPLVNATRARINALALAARLPTMHSQKEYVEAGGLMSYGPNISDLFRRAAEYVDKILRGTNPGDIPVEQPTKFDLVVNMTTAKALGLEVPPSLLARADEVIE